MAKKYLEYETLREFIDVTDWYHSGPNGLMIGAKNENEAIYRATDIFTVIENAPAADVAPVIHGEWIPIVNYFYGKPDGRYYCSVCRRVETIKDVYCRACGARMNN